MGVYSNHAPERIKNEKRDFFEGSGHIKKRELGWTLWKRSTTRWMSEGGGLVVCEYEKHTVDSNTEISKPQAFASYV